MKNLITLFLLTLLASCATPALKQGYPAHNQKIVKAVLDESTEKFDECIYESSLYNKFSLTELPKTNKRRVLTTTFNIMENGRAEKIKIRGKATKKMKKCLSRVLTALPFAEVEGGGMISIKKKMYISK